MPKIVVHLLFKDQPCETHVWLSEYAAEQIEAEFGNDAKKFMKKLKTFAQGGFWNFEGEEWKPIRHEYEGAYRVRHKSSSLFRLIGFYEDETKRTFVALDGFLKHRGDQYTAKQWSLIQDVARIKAEPGWERDEEKGQER